MIEPLMLQKKSEVLLNTIIYPMLLHFPKSEKFTLCQEIKQSCYRMIRTSIQCSTAWLGHARHSNSYNLAKKIFEKYDYIQIEDKNWKFGDISPKKRKEMESRGKRNHT